MHAYNQLALLRHLKTKQLADAEGFTLVELMIVVAVIGILSAVALPQYLNARNRAAAGAAVGEAIGLAKECAVAQASQLAATVAGASGTCDGTGPVTFNVTWGGTAAPGVRCLTKTLTTETSLTVTASSNGGLSCT